MITNRVAMRRRLPAVATLPAVHVAHLPVLTGAWLVVVAGLNKVWRPGPTARAVNVVLGSFASRSPVGHVATRAFGVLEIAVGTGTLASSAPAWTWALSALYAAFACFVVAALTSGAPLRSCGCFGVTDRPPSAVHVALDAAVAGFGVAVVTDGALGAPHDSLVASHGLGAALSLVLCAAIIFVLRRGRDRVDVAG